MPGDGLCGYPRNFWRIGVSTPGGLQIRAEQLLAGRTPGITAGTAPNRNFSNVPRRPIGERGRAEAAWSELLIYSGSAMVCRRLSCERAPINRLPGSQGHLMLQSRQRPVPQTLFQFVRRPLQGQAGLPTGLPQPIIICDQLG